MPKSQSKNPSENQPEGPAQGPAEKNRRVAEGANAHDVAGTPAKNTGAHFEHHAVEEQGQGQLEAEDFFSENHFVDEPEERNLK